MMTQPCPMCAGVVDDAPLCPRHEALVDLAEEVHASRRSDWPGIWPFLPNHIALQREAHGPMGRPGRPWIVQVVCLLEWLGVWWEE